MRCVDRPHENTAVRPKLFRNPLGLRQLKAQPPEKDRWELSSALTVSLPLNQLAACLEVIIVEGLSYTVSGLRHTASTDLPHFSLKM